MFGRLVLLTLAAPLMVCAADLKTKSGKVYKDYEITGANAGGIVIFHESGTATVAPADWPDALKNEIAGYMAEQKNKAAERAVAVAQKNERIAHSSITVDFRARLLVLSVLPDGVIAMQRGEDEPVFIGEVTGYTDGEYIKYNVKEKRKANKQEQRCRTITKPGGINDMSIQKSKEYYSVNKPYYYDDEFFRCYRIGVYKYTAVSGAAKTVQRYTVDRKTALEYMKNNK